MLLASETSRNILKFYRPQRLVYGVRIVSATLGNSLSLTSEINWYIRRYVNEVFLEISPELYCTLAFAQNIYERNNKLQESWNFSKLIAIKRGRLTDAIFIQPHSALEDYPQFCEKADNVLTVWCTQEEWESAGEIADPKEYQIDTENSTKNETIDTSQNSAENSQNNQN